MVWQAAPFMMGEFATYSPSSERKSCIRDCNIIGESGLGSRMRTVHMLMKMNNTM